MRDHCPYGRPGSVVQYDRPVWEPLEAAGGTRLAEGFMWMHEARFAGGSTMHVYKHIHTRRYLYLSEDGRASSTRRVAATCRCGSTTRSRRRSARGGCSRAGRRRTARRSSMRSCGRRRPFASVRPPPNPTRGAAVRICLMIEGQEGVEWADWVALASSCERLGFDALFRSDHYLSVG